MPSKSNFLENGLEHKWKFSILKITFVTLWWTPPSPIKAWRHSWTSRKKIIIVANSSDYNIKTYCGLIRFSLCITFENLSLRLLSNDQFLASVKLLYRFSLKKEKWVVSKLSKTFKVKVPLKKYCKQKSHNISQNSSKFFAMT